MRARKSKLQTKVLLTIGALWVSGSLLLVLLSSLQVSDALTQSVRTRLRDYAGLGAMGISGDEHAALRTREDEGKKEYSDVFAALKGIKANCADVEFVYTVRKGEGGKVVFVGDSTESEADRSHVGDPYDDATPLLKRSVEGLAAPVLEDKFYTNQWGTFLSAYAPIRTSDGGFDGILCIDISFGSVRKLLLANLLKLILAASCCLLLVVPAALVLTRDIVKPIKDCLGFTELLARNDYSREASAFLKPRRDEIGDLLSAYNKMVENTRGLIQSIKEQSGVLSEIGLDLSSNMEETAASLNEINAGIQSIKQETINQSASVTETISTMEQITGNIERMGGHIDQQAASVVQSSAAVQEMLANISSVTSTLVKNAESVGELTAASERGRADLGVVSEKIRDVAKESESLMEISKIIQAIASQTNLLAMNAAIEAAHAGESGSGFSVVADEIRKLAESSGSQSKTISNSLRKMKAEMDLITGSTEKVLGQFAAIDERIRLVSEHERGIRDAMSEQDTGGKEILEAVAQLNDLTSQIKSGFGEMMTGSAEVLKESRNLSRITEEVTSGIDEMASGVAQISAAANSVNDISRTNKESSEALAAELGKFKV